MTDRGWLPWRSSKSMITVVKGASAVPLTRSPAIESTSSNIRTLPENRSNSLRTVCSLLMIVPTSQSATRALHLTVMRWNCGFFDWRAPPSRRWGCPFRCSKTAVAKLVFDEPGQPKNRHVQGLETSHTCCRRAVNARLWASSPRTGLDLIPPGWKYEMYGSISGTAVPRVRHLGTGHRLR
jgi:hypothetical protein